MKKVLIITYYWPPAGGPGVQRVLKFVKYLTEFDWLPVVLTIEDGDYPAIDESLISQVPKDCVVYKTKVIEPYNLYKKFIGKSREEFLPTSILNIKTNEGVKEKIAKWVRTNIFIPDGRIGWIPIAVKTGLGIIKSEKIDLIFSTSPPHTVQLIARKLSIKTNTKWIADFRDPWAEAFWSSELKKNFIAQKIDNHLEKSVLERANAITTVTDGLIEMFESKANNNYMMIQNGIEHIEIKEDKSDMFLILFFGHLSKFQNPESLFEAVNQLAPEVKKRVEIYFIGHVFEGFNPMFDKYNNLQITLKKYMPKDKLMEFGQKASLLFRPVAKSNYSSKSVGAKTYDYLALRKPILTLGPKNSFSNTLLSETGSGELFEYHDIENISNYIKKYFTLWKEKQFILLNNKDKLEKYKTVNQVQNLSNFFNSII